jgi:hypothetical protein
MPHVKISYPYKTKDGERRTQGQVLYVTSAEAKTIEADGRGKVVKLDPADVVKVANGESLQAPSADIPQRPAEPAPVPVPPAVEAKPARRAPVKRDDADE